MIRARVVLQSIVLVASLLSWSVAATADEDPAGRNGPAASESADQWVERLLGDNLPWSFVFDGQASRDLLPRWTKRVDVQKLDDVRTQHTRTWTDPATGLEVRCVAVVYRDFPALEWTLYFKNTGATDTPILADIQAIDASFACPEGGEFTLHHIRGDNCTTDSFQPLVETLGPKASKTLAPVGGRPTCGAWPYWNLATQDKGFIVALGWPGQWAARFDRDEGRALQIRAGQELTRFKLLPGEEVRSPLVALLFYEGDWLRGQNLWRRWMIAHNLPRPEGKLVPTHYGTCWSIDLHPRADVETAILQGFLREKIPIDFYYIDAGWYPGTGNWWETTGTWEVDKTRFPKGIREVSDLAHANNIQFVLWFEPERAWRGTWLAENHPEWILGGQAGGLVNLGNPDAWNWVVERIDALITSEGVDVYRQDFNIAPLDYWRGADPPDRQGITEIKHVVGYLAFWDELRRRHPKLWIDSCASGGRRNDLETMRRSVPLLRSDCAGDPLGQQCHTYGLSLWLPYYGSGQGMADVYWFRSCIFPASRVGCDTRDKTLDYPLLRRMIDEYRKVQPYLLGDYYPLTPYSLEKSAWIAWQFDEPGQGGFVQAFRREEAAEDTLVLRLAGLDPQATYALENLDDGRVEHRTGEDLITKGLTITLPDRPRAALFVYRVVK